MGAVHDVATGTPIEVNADGSINVTVLGTLTLASPLAVTGPLTDTQLRATAVPTKEARATGTPTPSAFAASVSNAQILAANASRLGATIYNDNTSANLFVKLGVTATTAAGGHTFKLAAGGYYETPYGYTGEIDGIWDSSSGNAASITELT